MHFKFSYISNKISDGVDYFLLPGITCRSYIAYIQCNFSSDPTTIT